jgi:hypothetical protein
VNTPSLRPIAVSIPDACAMTGVSREVLRQAIRRGDIPVHYPSSRPVIPVDELEAWLRSTPTQPRP